MVAPIVSDVMHRDVPLIRDDAPYKEVATALATSHTGALPVVTADGKLAGIVSESDLLRRPAAGRTGSKWRNGWRHGKAQARIASQLMSRPIVHVEPNTDLSTAARLAVAANVHQMPVLDGDQLVGMVDRTDLLANYLRSDDTIRDEIVNRVIVDDFCIDPACIDVQVRDGIVSLSGCVEHRPIGAFLARTVRAVSGVVEVEDRLSWRHDLETADSLRRRRFLP
jgi:CBS domain-containing protein